MSQQIYQKVDPDLRSHPAFFNLVAELDTTPIMAHGLLAGLWAMCFRQAEDGNLTRFNPKMIALAIGWPGDGEAMIEALVDSGFLDREDGQLVVHDWFDWGGALCKEQSRKREDKRRSRTNQSVEHCVHVTSGHHSSPTVTSGHHSSPLVTVYPEPEPEPEPDKELLKSKTDSEETICPRILHADAYAETVFDTLWKAYPRKVGRKVAFKAFMARVHEGQDPDLLAKAAANYSAYCKRDHKEEEFILHGQTFFGPNERWMDHITPLVKSGLGRADVTPCLNDDGEVIFDDAGIAYGKYDVHLCQRGPDGQLLNQSLGEQYIALWGDRNSDGNLMETKGEDSG